MAKAYPHDQPHSTRHKLKSRTLHVIHNKQVFPGAFGAEARQKTYLSRDVHLNDDSSQQHRADSPGSNQYNQYHSVESRENSPKLPIESNKEPHFDSGPSPHNSEWMKYSFNNASEKNDRSYEDNYPVRQSQSEYNDNTRRKNYKMTMESFEAENKQYDSSDERDKSKEHQRFTPEDARYEPIGLRYSPTGLTYEPTEGADKVKQEFGYHKFEEKERKLSPYPQDTPRYPPDGPHDQESYLKTNNKNHQNYSPKPTVNPASGSKQFYSHQRRHQFADDSYQNPNKRPLSPSRDSLQYPQYKKEVGLVNPYDRDSNNPQQFNFEDRRVYHHQEPEGHYYGPSSSDPSDSYRQPPEDKEMSKDGESKDEESRDEDYSDANQQNGRNQLKVVSTKKDMQPLPSESDRNLSEEHDGFLDMGAYTDKQGSFGWYADYPVGKEHDKVTYSFS